MNKEAEASMLTKASLRELLDAGYTYGYPEIHVNYESLGNFRKTIKSYIKETVKQVEEDRGTLQENSFYLNSSDSTESLLGLDLHGKKVMTVSGSGEFAHLFINAGAEEVVSFDVSPGAAFYSELRHTALCNLSMDEYVKLFGEWLTLDNDDREEGAPFINKEIYVKIESKLSEEARTYFDLIFKTPNLLNHRMFSWSGFSRDRVNTKTKFNRLFGDIITDEKKYKEIQKKARKVKYTQVLANANNIDNLVKSFIPDVLYVSNIGYYPDKIIGLAKKCLDAGVPEVICTISKNERTFNDVHADHLEDFFAFYYQDQKIEIGSIFTYELYGEDYETIPVTVEVTGTDRNADYGLVFRVTKG